MRASNLLKQQIQQSLAADNLHWRRLEDALGKLNARRTQRCSIFSRMSGCGEGVPGDPCRDSFRVPPQAELSAPSSPFLPSGFEEPETSPVEETFADAEPPMPGDKLLVGSAGSRGHGDWAQESSGEEQQLPELYQRLVVEAMEPPEPVSEYISNPGTSALPPEPDTAPDSPEPDCSPLSVFPTTFLTPALCCEGNLTLDRVKLDCSSFPR